MIINPKVSSMEGTIASSILASQSESSTSIVAAIKEAVNGVNNQGGDIVIPVYLGGTMLDEVIVTAQQRASLRSGGR